MFREFKVGELFGAVGRGTRLTKQNRIAGHVPLVTAGRENQGVAEYIQENKQLFRGPVFTIDMFGNVFARDYDFYADDNIIVFGRDGLSIDHYLYIASALGYLSGVYGYGNQFRVNSIAKTFIQLPVKEGTDEVNYTEDDIDWDWMESTIRELKESTIRELDAYLKETGLDDYQLTDDEREVLEREPTFKEFEVIDLFDVINTKSIRQSDIRDQLQSNDGSTPYITASDKNNAIFAYIDCPQEWIDKGNCIFIGGKTTTVTYQEYDFCSNDSHNLALYLKNEQARTKRIQLYLAAILKKAFATKYQWSNALSKTKIKAESIHLPVKSGTDEVNYTDADIDWDYMESYVRAMEKQVIADVVDYKNEVIATTKELVHTS